MKYIRIQLRNYDWIVLNSSAGKDSSAMLDYVVGECDRAGVSRDRLVVVHCDLGRVEWPGTKQLAADQAAHYGLRFEVVTREKGDLLDQIEQRGMFPSSTARYCTSDQKTSQVTKLMTRLVQDARDAGHTGPVRILNCLGIRAQESPARAKKEPFGRDAATNGKRTVDRWLPIFEWTEEQVWDTIRASGVPYHPAYDAGMPRLSCVFCVLAGERELVLAARLNPALADTYAAVEQRIGHTFQNGRSMADLIAKAADPDYSTDRPRPASELQPCLF